MNHDLWGTQMYLISTSYAKKIIELYDRPFHEIKLRKNDNNCILTSELITRESNGLVARPPLALEECTNSEIAISETNHHEALKLYNYDDYSKGEITDISPLSKK